VHLLETVSGPHLATALRSLGVADAQLELSVRRAGDALRADRVMIERAPVASIDPILAAMGLARGAGVDALLDAGAELPLITGWDRARGAAKIYVNASDASDAARASLAARLGLAGPAHVVGLNVLPDGREELKRYVQSARGEPPFHGARLVASAGPLCGGVVRSERADGAPRAWFVALREAPARALDAAFGWLPGFRWAAVEAALPFAPAPPRSIGIAWERPSEWTVYVKPRGAGEPAVWSLEPLAVFTDGVGEVAVHLGPADAPAYAVVGERSVSYRVRGGTPSAAQITRLLDWVVARLADAGPLEDPPAPWRSRAGSG